MCSGPILAASSCIGTDCSCRTEEPYQLQSYYNQIGVSATKDLSINQTTSSPPRQDQEKGTCPPTDGYTRGGHTRGPVPVALYSRLLASRAIMPGGHARMGVGRGSMREARGAARAQLLRPGSSRRPEVSSLQPGDYPDDRVTSPNSGADVGASAAPAAHGGQQGIAGRRRTPAHSVRG